LGDEAFDHSRAAANKKMEINQRTDHAITSKIQYLRDRKKYGFGILEKIAVSLKMILIF
jgi:hypothetical protein